jgi:hypothetical protein
VGGHWFADGTTDPWNTTYTSNADGEADISISMTAEQLGFDPRASAGHTVVVHSTAEKIACGVLSTSTSTTSTTSTTDTGGEGSNGSTTTTANVTTDVGGGGGDTSNSNSSSSSSSSTVASSTTTGNAGNSIDNDTSASGKSKKVKALKQEAVYGIIAAIVVVVLLFGLCLGCKGKHCCNKGNQTDYGRVGYLSGGGGGGGGGATADWNPLASNSQRGANLELVTPGSFGSAAPPPAVGLKSVMVAETQFGVEEDVFMPIEMMLSNHGAPSNPPPPSTTAAAAAPWAAPRTAAPAARSAAPLWSPTHRMQYEFEATAADQLSLGVGTSVRVLFRQSTEWWNVETGPGGAHGLVPAGYLAEGVSRSAPPPPPATAAATAGVVATHYACFEFVATSAAELTVQRGQTVALISQEGPWWKVLLIATGQQGLIPHAFLKAVEDKPVVPPIPPTQPSGGATAAPAVPVAVAARVVATAPVARVATVSLASIPADGGKLHVAQHEWVSTDPAHISFSAGDFVRVVSHEAGGVAGWWRGSCVASTPEAGGPASTGLFPGSYVRAASEAEEAALKMLQQDAPDLAPTPAPAPAPAPADFVPAASVPTPTPASTPAPITESAAESRGSVLVVAQFEYEPEKDDELGFPDGAEIEVTQKNDDGWWAGHLLDPSGARIAFGFFPENYVV